MSARSLPEAFKLIMKERGWTQARLAKALGKSETFVSRVMRQNADPAISKVIKLLDRVGWEVHLMRKVEDDPVKRRDFVASAATFLLVSADKTDPHLDASYIHALSQRLANLRYELGGVPLADKALANIKRVSQTVGHDSGRELSMAAAALADQVALILYDAGRLTAAEHAGAAALRYSIQANDFPGQADAYNALSRINSYQGDFARGVQYARQGLALPDLAVDQRAFLNMRLGRSLARIPGQQRDSLTAFQNALNADGLSPLGKASVMGDVGIGFGLLREYREAGTLLEQAANLTEHRSPLFHAQYLGRQIQTALNASEPAVAADRMFTLSRTAPLVSSSRLDRRMAEIIASSRQWSEIPEVREARDRLRAVMSVQRPA